MATPDSTLTSTLNRPVDPFSMVGQINRGGTAQERASTARRLEESAMREQSEALRRQEETEAQAKLAQIGKEEELEKKYVEGLKGAQTKFESTFGDMPERKISTFDANAGMELASLTAILGAFGGSVSGRAGLKAVEGISRGYSEGREDLYNRELKTYEAELERYKQRINNAKTIYDNALKLETAKRGAGQVELKKLESALQGSVIAAKAKARDLVGLGKSIEEAKKAGDAAELTLAKSVSKGGLKPSATERDKYSQQYELLNLGSQIQEKLKDPKLAKLVDQPRIRAGLFLQEESKLIDQLLQPGIPQDVRQLAILIKKYRNQVYRVESGLAVTAYEAMRQYGANPQPGSTSKTLLDQVEVLNEVANRSIQKLEVIYPELQDVGYALREYQEMEQRERNRPRTRQTATAADVEVTARENNLTIEQAKTRLREAGFLIEGEE